MSNRRAVVYLSKTENQPVCIEFPELNHALSPEQAIRMALDFTKIAAALIEGAEKVDAGEWTGIEDPTITEITGN